jgi:hypothetical protein
MEEHTRPMTSLASRLRDMIFEDVYRSLATEATVHDLEWTRYRHSEELLLEVRALIRLPDGAPRAYRCLIDYDGVIESQFDKQPYTAGHITSD